MGFPQRLLADDERLVLVLRRHAIVLFSAVLIFVVTLAVVIGVLVVAPDGSKPWLPGVVAVIGLLIVLRWTLWPVLVWLNTLYVITTTRLILRSGVLNRTGRDMPLSRLNDVSFEHNLFERMLGCGTLMVESGGERGQLVLTQIPKVEVVQRTLHELADNLHGYDGREVDPGLARSLDAEFGDEYQGPSAGSPEYEQQQEPYDRQTDRGRTGRWRRDR